MCRFGLIIIVRRSRWLCIRLQRRKPVHFLLHREEPTTFSWTKGKNANTYNVNIETGSPGQMHTYKEVWNLQDTFYQITLPEGYYEVCVYGCNSFSYSGSNVVKFNVQKGKEPEPVPDPEPEPDTPVNTVIFSFGIRNVTCFRLFWVSPYTRISAIFTSLDLRYSIPYQVFI